MKPRILFLFILISIVFAACVPAEKPTVEVTQQPKMGIQPKDSLIRLSNDLFTLTIDQFGGAFFDLSLKSNPINPLTWSLKSEQMPPNNQKGAPFKGHFLCLGRWGSPSKAEIETGIPHNGEQSNTLWEIETMTESSVKMDNSAPLDGLEVSRETRLLEGSAATFLVKETFTNSYSLGRVSNVVQHVTIGPPFLNPTTLINSNAKQGFNQAGSFPNPHANEFMWPIAYLDSTKQTTDLRSTATPDNYCMTHIFDESDTYGWVTAYDPVSGVLLGYVWKLEEYPWINIWSHYENGKPFAKGLEFGTTGIGRKYKDLLEVDSRFYGKNSWEYIEAGESIEKSFIGFLIDLGKNKENPELQIVDNGIILNGESVTEIPF